MKRAIWVREYATRAGKTYVEGVECYIVNILLRDTDEGRRGDYQIRFDNNEKTHVVTVNPEDVYIKTELICTPTINR